MTKKYRPVLEDVVDLGDTGSRVVLLSEVFEVDLGLGLDENVLVTVLDKISGFARQTEDEKVDVINLGQGSEVVEDLLAKRLGQLLDCEEISLAMVARR